MRSLAAVVVAAMGGFIVLVLEIIGARYLAKDFGGSFYVWVSQIGVILLALAVGYAAGGALADRFAGLTVLVVLLVPAGLFTVLVPNLAPPVLDAIISRHPPQQAIPLFWQKVDPALGSLCVFLLPCLVLAMIPPFLIRWVTPRVDRVGRSSGAVIAAGTVGSIAGVVAAGYFLLEWMRISDIFRAMGALTLLVAALCAVIDRWLGRVDSSPAPPPIP
ncbi:MAG TPA: fused MFS/spermidine synthase [Verrucomicrobiota bacterium]|nr:fused MFS/spermidine synthase [Verrucomicrobiota bacterium]HNU51564.1 fused MFS/spermidine synthase [Verrucomicrobiota bacterium]